MTCFGKRMKIAFSICHSGNWFIYEIGTNFSTESLEYYDYVEHNRLQVAHRHVYFTVCETVCFSETCYR